MSSTLEIRQVPHISTSEPSSPSFSSPNSAIKMLYTPTSAMSRSVVHIEESGAATAENEHGDKESERGLDTLLISAVEGGDVDNKLSVEIGMGMNVVEMALPSALPSPPLTRVSTSESRSTRGGAGGEAELEDVDVEKEMDISAWRESMRNVGDKYPEPEEEELEGEDADEGDEEEEEEEVVGSEACVLGPRGNDEWTDADKASTGPLHQLRDDIAPNSPSPPAWEVVHPTAPGDKHREADSRSQRNSTKSPRRRITSSKRFIPKSSYYYKPPPRDSAFGTEPIGQIGVHHPREIVRIERDYTGGELVQFAPVYPLEFEGRISATKFLESINAVNEMLISAHSLRHSCIDNFLAFFTLQLSKLVKTSHYEKEMQRLKQLINGLNAEIFNPVGLHVLWPRDVAFMFLEIEYY